MSRTHQNVIERSNETQIAHAWTHPPMYSGFTITRRVKCLYVFVVNFAHMLSHCNGEPKAGSCNISIFLQHILKARVNRIFTLEKCDKMVDR
ncbi:MAG: hypothetical protein HA492_02835 [Candidatus Verstraetearchaeota archaeon]|nr:hypothetical protein [Candidatus Verstraetearchaeota archaeon]